MSKKDRRRNHTSSIGKGFIFLIVGAFFLLRSMNLNVPAWVFSWQMLLIGIGGVIWLASEFKNFGGLIMMFVGGIFLMKDIYIWPFDIARFIWPAALIVVGIFLIFRRQEDRRSSWSSWSSPSSPSSPEDDTIRKPEKYQAFSYTTGSDEYLDVTSTFSGVNRVVVSKEFKGGKVHAFFGGVDVNLTQADFNGTIEMDVNCMFGGIELVVPSNWHIKVHINCLFGGVEDNRPIEMLSKNPDKILVLKGSCTFGGVEIKSY
jgi:predicted membrane protein